MISAQIKMRQQGWGLQNDLQDLPTNLFEGRAVNREGNPLRFERRVNSLHLSLSRKVEIESPGNKAGLLRGLVGQRLFLRTIGRDAVFDLVVGRLGDHFLP